MAKAAPINKMRPMIAQTNPMIRKMSAATPKF
jgi:hypothetical protein